MALTLSELTGLRDALIRARASGVLTVRDSSGELITYKDDASQARAIADLESRIAAMQSGKTNVVKFNVSKFGDSR